MSATISAFAVSAIHGATSFATLTLHPEWNDNSISISSAQLGSAFSRQPSTPQ
jgi:hypothetical protein